MQLPIPTIFLRTNVRAWILLPVLMHGGCSLIASSDDERRALPPGPTTPVIEILPSVPRTDDDLVARIESQSVDPEGEEVTYTYEWSRDGVVVDTGEILRRANTAKAETWTLRVTAHAGSRHSEPAESHVVIANTVPRILRAGLSRYDLLRDEVVSTFSDATDADGDALALRVRWTLDDQDLPDTTSSLTLASIPAVPTNAKLRVTITPFDGETEGEPLVVGPATIRREGTQWRPLAPSLEGGCLIPDPERRRMLYAGNLLWEYSLDVGRWIRLLPEGTPPPTAPGQCVVDSKGARAFLFLPYNKNFHTADPAWHPPVVLHFEGRGNERWAPLPVPIGGETGASERLHATAAYDHTRERILFFGGYDPFGLEFHGDLWSLDVSAAATGYHRLSEVAAPGRLIASAMTIDTERNRAYLFGGTRASDPSGTVLTPSSDIWAVDLVTGTIGSDPIAQLPAATSLAGVVAEGDGSFLVGLGFASVTSISDRLLMNVGTASSAISRFNSRDNTISALSNDDISGTAAGFVGFKDGDDLVLGSPSVPNHDFLSGSSATALVRMARDGSSTTAVHVAGVTYPLVSDAATTTDQAGRLHVLFGRAGTFLPETSSFVFDPSGRWERVPSTSPAPAPRWGAAQFSGSNGTTFRIAGGTTGDGAPVLASLYDIWEYDATTRTWRRLHDGSGLPAGFPSSLRFANVWTACGAYNTNINVYGGSNGTNDPVFTLACPGNGNFSECTTWFTRPNLAGANGRSTSISVFAGGTYILRGVSTASDRSLDKVPEFNTCTANVYTPTGLTFPNPEMRDRSRAHAVGGGILFYALASGSMQIARLTSGTWTVEDVVPMAGLPDPHPGPSSADWDGDMTAYSSIGKRLFLYRGGAVWELHFAP